MTPKEKAQELSMKFLYEISTELNPTENQIIERDNIAKRCAIIAADEVIKTLSPYLGDDNARDYWNEVKQEIQSL